MPGIRSHVLILIAMAIVWLAGSPAVMAMQVQVPVPRITIYPGQVIDEGMLVDAAVETAAALPPSTVTTPDGLVGKIARQTLLPNRPIDQSAVRESYLVKQGQSARVVFQSGALTITSVGLALQSGVPGDSVSVRNVDSGRIITGLVGTDGAVHLGDP